MAQSDVIVVGAGLSGLVAARAILALPPALLRRVAFTPDLPPARARLHERMPMGSVIKCVASYERPFWREAGYSGEAFSTAGLVRATFDDCSPSGDHAALVAFVVGDAARELSRRCPTRDARRAEVLAALARLHGPAAAAPVGYVDKDWVADEWSTGCYVGIMPPGLLSEAAGALRAPAGRLHFAGTETAPPHGLPRGRDRGGRARGRRGPRRRRARRAGGRRPLTSS
jgi:monoamine oxidase